MFENESMTINSTNIVIAFCDSKKNSPKRIKENERKEEREEIYK
jgi:hypothetical protein